MADKVITSTGDCSACCEPPADCSCALLIPPFAAPYADYATAETAIADQTDNCIGYCVQDGDTGNVFSFAFDGTTITGSADTAYSSPTLALSSYCYFSVSLKSGATVTVPWSISTDGPETVVSASIFDCATGDFVAGENIPPNAGASGTLSFVVPADGEYVLLISGTGTLGILTYVNFAFTVTCDMDYWVNPVIALWDDSGTTRSLWACPKLLLPPLTESTGTWYADCAAADAVLTDALQVSNCVGYCGFVGFDPLVSFTATDGGSSLSFSIVTTSPEPGVMPIYGSVNAESGETITVASSGGQYVTFSIYDDTGTLVEALTTPGVTTLTSSALPYTGRYTVEVSLFDPGDMPTTWTASITSSGTMSVNPIQARYDLGLTCAATLDCGDACP